VSALNADFPFESPLLRSTLRRAETDPVLGEWFLADETIFDGERCQADSSQVWRGAQFQRQC
jgi:hypothetical protein